MMFSRSVRPLPSWLLVALSLAMVIVAIVYVVFTRINTRRVVGVYLDKANNLKRHDQYGTAIETLDKAIALDPQNLHIQTEQLKIKIFKLTRKFDPLNRLLDLDELDKAEADCKKLTGS